MSEPTKTFAHVHVHEDCILRPADARELLEYLERELQARGYLPGVMLQLAGSIMLTVSCAVVDEEPKDVGAVKQCMRVMLTVTQSVIEQTWRYWKAAQSAHEGQKQQGN